MKYNKNLVNNQATAELLGLFTPRLKPLIYAITKVLKILFECFKKSNVMDIVFTNSTKAVLRFPHSDFYKCYCCNP